MKSIKEVKTVVKALRKEFSSLAKPAAELSHSETIDLLARATGYPTWEAMRAKLYEIEGGSGSEPTGQPARDVALAARIGYLPDWTPSTPEALPSYQLRGLVVSLNRDPGDERTAEYMRVELSEVNEDGEALEECQYSTGCIIDPRDKRKAALKTRAEFVKAVAEAVAPYLSKDFGLRAMGKALHNLGSGDFDAFRAEVEATGALPWQDEVELGESGKLETIDGRSIIGTFENMAGHSLLNSVSRNPNGTLEVEFEGETVVWWDSGVTVHQRGERMFVTSDYETVPESRLKLVPGDQAPPSQLTRRY